MLEAELQRSYYARTANQYDAMQGGDAYHNFALQFLMSTMDGLGAKSLLDVGSGTGRVLSALSDRPDIKSAGIEPVAELREAGHRKGIINLIDGSAYHLPFEDSSFDVVCAFGVMHHLAEPDRAAMEMLRVARLAIFISDHNDWGRGSRLTAALKHAARDFGLWWLYRLLITRGKGYRITDDDGLWYPYSIFETYKVMKPHCSKIHLLGTSDAGPNLYRSASHVAMLAIL